MHNLQLEHVQEVSLCAVINVFRALCVCVFCVCVCVGHMFACVLVCKVRLILSPSEREQGYYVNLIFVCRAQISLLTRLSNMLLQLLLIFDFDQWFLLVVVAAVVVAAVTVSPRRGEMRVDRWFFSAPLGSEVKYC